MNPASPNAASPSRALAAWIALVLSSAASAADLADPTRPPPGYGASQRADDPQAGDSTPAPEPVELQMIAHDGTAPLAVLNGHRVRVGDGITLDGKTANVVAIHDDSIELDRNGHRQMVQLTPQVRLK
jgi:opacity protein-like surface antigen